MGARKGERREHHVSWGGYQNATIGVGKGGARGATGPPNVLIGGAWPPQ